MALPTLTSLSANAEEVVDVRPLTLKLLEGSVTISDMTLTTRDCRINAFRAALFTGRIVHCIAILRPIVQ
jgi:hypothetical protein